MTSTMNPQKVVSLQVAEDLYLALKEATRYMRHSGWCGWRIGMCTCGMRTATSLVGTALMKAQIGGVR